MICLAPRSSFAHLHHLLLSGLRAVAMIALPCMLAASLQAQFNSAPTDLTKLKVWSPKRTYTFQAVFTDPQGKLITSEKITIHPTGQIWERDPQQTLADFTVDFSAADSARLAPFPVNGVQRAWSRNYHEGVIENDSRVWMHPLRSNQYLYTELAPFPEIKKPIEEGQSWKSSLFIYEAFGSFEGTVQCSYVTMGREERAYDFATLKCWEVIASGTHTKMGVNKATFYFNEDYGFTEMNYRFYNGHKLEIKLLQMMEN
jgi:hypothetical protein